MSDNAVAPLPTDAAPPEHLTIIDAVCRRDAAQTERAVSATCALPRPAGGADSACVSG